MYRVVSVEFSVLMFVYRCMSMCVYGLLVIVCWFFASLLFVCMSPTRSMGPVMMAPDNGNVDGWSEKI